MTAPASPATRPFWRVARFILVVALIVAGGWQLYGQWQDASRSDLKIEFHAGWLIAASALVFVTYLLLIETWRQVLRQLGAKMEFGTTARIWFASNLGKYIPGKIWTITSMMAMLKEQGVALPVSGASAVVITIAYVATGFAVVLVTSMDAVARLTGGATSVIVVTIGLIASLAAAPLLTQQWNRIAKFLGREQLSVNVPLAAIAPALVGCAISWFLYGLAFQWLVRSVLGQASGSVENYTTAYTASYLVGYLTLIAPGGLGARELALVAILPPLGLATAAQAAVITIASRLWLTVVELIPSLIAAAKSARSSVAR